LQYKKGDFLVFSFPEVSGFHINSLTHNVNCYRELLFGYRQDTSQAVHAGQKPLFDVNCLSYNKDIWAKKLSFLPFKALLLFVFPPVLALFLQCSRAFLMAFYESFFEKLNQTSFFKKRNNCSLNKLYLLFN
jgi:hypothetical protein